MLFAITLLPLLLEPAPRPRIEDLAIGAAARRLAADVLTDADALIDLVLVDGAAMFEVALAGERHELRLELDAEGGVIGAAVWWLGAGDVAPRGALALALPALDDAGTLDAVVVEDGVVSVVAGGIAVPVDDDVWGC